MNDMDLQQALRVKDEPSRCGPSQGQPGPAPVDSAGWTVGAVETPAGSVSQVATRLSRSDRLRAIAVRLGIGRMSYAVAPVLYAAGSPGPQSPVLVSANYKLSFDRLRQELVGLDAWILVLDTKGINVWCAAGKGTFGTDEIVRLVEESHLSQVVGHRTLIVPQLGAPGVAAHEVKERSGFRVVYGPVRASDISAFLAAGMKALPAMRRVRFGLGDRLAVAPMALVGGGKRAVVLAACLLVLAGLGRGGYDVGLAASAGLRAALLVLLAFVGGAMFAPILLPWLPGRMFSTKGAVVGLALACGAALLGLIPSPPGKVEEGKASAGPAGRMEIWAWLLVMPAIAAFLAMDFTGASTYTSLSGVRREIRRAVPLQAAAGVVGLGLWIAARFV